MTTSLPPDGDMTTLLVPATPTPSWSAIQPKVSIAGLTYGFTLFVLSLVQNDFGVEISTTTATGGAGFVMLLAAYMWPDGRHDSREV